MSKVKSVSAVAEFVSGVRDCMGEIVAGEQQSSRGYRGLTLLVMDRVKDVEIETGQTFEKIGRSSTGKLADLTLAIRDNIETIASEQGHKQPRGVWQKVKKLADQIRNESTISDKSGDAEAGGRNFKAVDEYIIEKMIACFNKAHRQIGESKEVDSVRSDLLKILTKLGVKSTDNRLATNK